MYPFPHLREHQARLWAAVRAHLAEAPDELDVDTELHAVWHRPDLLVGQTCGWPLVTELDGEVEVIGTFDVNVPFASNGRYRSVLVANKPIGLQEWQRNPGTIVARNNADSLSGWVSLCNVWGSVPDDVVETGAHLESMRTVARGDANVAIIDAVSYEFITEMEPFTSALVHVIGHGPVIPCVPLVMSVELAHRRDEVRAAFAAAVVDPAVANACARLRIRGFVPFDRADYEYVRDLWPLPAG